MTTPAQPDATAVVIAYLASHPSVAATVSGSIIAANPSITVTRIGGPLDYPGWIDRPHLQLATYAATKAAAHDVAAAARAAMNDIPGTRGSAVITHVRESLGLSYAPEVTDHTERPRWLFAVYITLHPAT
jgi:hypothetical protein